MSALDLHTASATFAANLAIESFLPMEAESAERLRRLAEQPALAHA